MKINRGKENLKVVRVNDDEDGMVLLECSDDGAVALVLKLAVCRWWREVEMVEGSGDGIELVDGIDGERLVKKKKLGKSR